MQVWGKVSRVITGLQRSGRGGGETPEYCAHFPNMISPSHQPRALGNWGLAWRRIQKPWKSTVDDLNISQNGINNFIFSNNFRRDLSRLGHDMDER